MRFHRHTAHPLRTVLLSVLVLLCGLVAVPPAAADSSAMKSRFAVAVGGLEAGSTTNWVRLGQYEFFEDGTVDEEHWHWTQRRREGRTSTGVRAANCPSRDCTVATAHGYQSTAAPQRLTGVYSLDGSLLRIDWDEGGMWEEWEVAEAADGALAALELHDSDFGATHGYGYGSDAPWDARASAEQVAQADHASFDHAYDLWKVSAENPDPHIDSGSGSPFWMREWTVCGSGDCLGGRNTGSSTDYYVAPANTTSGGHRRDTLWHWRTALADGRGEYCYTGNSHVKPMIQVIDDAGEFHGWVGVEASLNETVPSEGVYGDDIGVFRIAAR